MSNDEQFPPPQPAGKVWTSSKRAWFAIFTGIGTVATVASVLGHFNPKISIAGAIATAICAGINQYFGFKATEPVVGRKQ